MISNQIVRFARALYDNVAEMPRELSFKKGDILTVYQEKYENSPDWWVCSLRSMTGLAPANRLEAMPILVEATPKYKTQISGSLYDELPDQPAVNHTYSNMPVLGAQINKKDEYSVYQMPNEDVYLNPLTNQTLFGEMRDDHTIYQMPSVDVRRESNTYFNISDLPVTNLNLEGRAASMHSARSNEYYYNRYDYSDSFSDSTSTSIPETVGSSLNSFNQLSLSSSESGDLKLLPSSIHNPIKLSQEETIAKFRQYQSDTVAGCNKVIEFAKAKWKSEEMLKLTIKSIKASFLDLYHNLQTLTNFSSSILENSKTCGDMDLMKKIWKHLQPLQDSLLIIRESIEKLDSVNWSPDKIAISVRLAVREGGDSLNLVVSSSRNVLIHIRSLSVTIIGNANVLFPDPSTYAFLKVDENNAVLPLKYDESNHDQRPHLTEIMRLFGQQMKSQTEHVNDTVNDFMKILPPQVPTAPSKDTIVSHSKFVVRSATQLVCVAKNLTDAQIKSIPNQKIELEGNNLCNSLKSMVNTTKELVTCQTNNFDSLIMTLKCVKTNAANLQAIVVDAVTTN